MVLGGRVREVPPGETAPMVFWVPRPIRDLGESALGFDVSPILATPHGPNRARHPTSTGSVSRVFQENRPKRTLSAKTSPRFWALTFHARFLRYVNASQPLSRNWSKPVSADNRAKSPVSCSHREQPSKRGEYICKILQRETRTQNMRAGTLHSTLMGLVGCFCSDLEKRTSKTPFL